PSPAHIRLMAEDQDEPDAPGKPKRDPAKHAKKDPARPTRAKAAREHLPPLAPALEKLLNPGIEKGTAGPGSQTGLKPPPDNSFDRRADFAAAHRARASTSSGFSEAPQKGYVGKRPLGPLDPDLARVWGIEEDEDSAASSPSPHRQPGVGETPKQGERGEQREAAHPGAEPGGETPLPDSRRARSSPTSAVAT